VGLPSGGPSTSPGRERPVSNQNRHLVPVKMKAVLRPYSTDCERGKSITTAHPLRAIRLPHLASAMRRERSSSGCRVLLQRDKLRDDIAAPRASAFLIRHRPKRERDRTPCGSDDPVNRVRRDTKPSARASPTRRPACGPNRSNDQPRPDRQNPTRARRNATTDLHPLSEYAAVSKSRRRLRQRA
jgi:hypothetical protein